MLKILKLRLALLAALLTLFSLGSCATSRSPKGCGCGFEERMGRH